MSKRTACLPLLIIGERHRYMTWGKVSHHATSSFCGCADGSKEGSNAAVLSASSLGFRHANNVM